ncbi:MAG: MerR family transcriptional regulator [Roseibacillus sp. TMED18]|nr:MAG: MerR family transcriptional regulator [Roseibacillus sp. TMED18]
MQNGSRQTFGIGAVARRTGLSASNIRMWESRYEAVVPDRTPSNRRLYGREDIERLSLLRSLTLRGHSISSIADLSHEELEERLAGDQLPSAPLSPKKRILVVGTAVAETLSANPSFDLELGEVFGDLRSAFEAPRVTEADLVVIEAETLFPETISSVRELVRRTKAPRTVLIYHFSASSTATALAKAIQGVQLLKAPVSVEQLLRHCMIQQGQPGIPIDPGPVPARLYTPDQLGQLAKVSTTVECECPQHLAGLLQGLAAFEKYSRECEDRNPEDALLHAFLYRTTARVRRTMEEALQHVVLAEGITVE